MPILSKDCVNHEVLREIVTQDYVKIQNDIEKFLKDSVLENKADGVIFGLSGGIDSAIVAYLSAKIFGKKALALVMPDSTISPSSETGDALKIIFTPFRLAFIAISAGILVIDDLIVAFDGGKSAIRAWIKDLTGIDLAVDLWNFLEK